MKVKNTMKSKNISNDKNEDAIEDSVDDEESVDEAEDDEEEVSDASEGDSDENEDIGSAADSGDDSDENDEELETNAIESDDGSDENDETDEDIAASATESDEDVSDEEAHTENLPTSKSEQIKTTLIKKYQESQGKRLYIRFPRSISDEELVQKAKELSPLITNVHKPRQKYARFCLVDFETKDNRDVTLKALKKLIKSGDLDTVEIPRTESADYVQQIAELKTKSLEDKKVKARLKRASKKAQNLKSFTSTVVVLNLPKTATVIQIRELFPSAVDVQIKTVKGGVNKDKSIAAITLPSTIDARAAVKNQQLSLGGNKLIVKFDNQKVKKKNSKKPQHINTKEKQSVEDNAGSDNMQTLPSKQIATEKKQGAMKHKVITGENVKFANKKRKLVPTSVQNKKRKEIT